MQNIIKRFTNSAAFPLSDCPCVSPADFRTLIHEAVSGEKTRIAALFFVPDCSGLNNPSGHAGSGQLYGVLNFAASGELGILTCRLTRAYPSLTPEIPQAHWFEREIYETWGITPEGHPWLKPLRALFPAKEPATTTGAPVETTVAGSPVRTTAASALLPEFGDFFHLAGEEVHEVAVGPVHAGVIEPGHFRFQCHGEKVFHLEISLGYQHRGIETALGRGPNKKTIHYMETLAGDSTIGHTLAYCLALEALSVTSVSAYAKTIRTVAAELERLANHIGDLGALAGDIGFLPSQNYCGRIRGDVLNLTGALCGNRFGRGLLIPGGVSTRLEAGQVPAFLQKLTAIEQDFRNAAELIFSTPSVLARLEGTGTIDRQLALHIGMVGPAARACGVVTDVRTQHPYSGYTTRKITAAIHSSGDCYARAYVRFLEAGESFAFIRRQLEALPPYSPPAQPPTLKPARLCVSLVEGWRGEICHVAATDAQGGFAFYKVTDPSFHNWFALALSLRGQQISDFPLCNKSFNLSYCGHDL